MHFQLLDIDGWLGQLLWRWLQGDMSFEEVRQDLIDALPLPGEDSSRMARRFEVVLASFREEEVSVEEAVRLLKALMISA